MRTQNTILSIVNFSGKDIEKTNVTIDHADNWDSGNARPDLNFTGALANGDARCEREEISKSTSSGCWFTIELIFKDKSTLSFRGNQWDAYSPQADGIYTKGLVKSQANENLCVFQTTGEDRYTYSNTYYLRQSQTPDNSKWMGDLINAHPNLCLNQMTMPGSHDAGMYTDITEKARTQTLSFGKQLKAGARYFDIRICADRNSDLWTYHGLSWGGKLSDILDEVSTFLDKSQNEVVFLKFRSYAEGDRQDTVNFVKKKLGTKLYKSSTTPNFATQLLKDLKGKVVAAFTSHYADFLKPKTGTHLYSDYGNEDTGSFIPHTTNNCLGVYDAYSHRSEFDIMKTDQLAKLAQHGGYGKPYLFLLSWTLTGSTDNVLDLKLLSSNANPQLAKALYEITQQSKSKKGNVPNIVYIDYLDPYLCRRIIDMNA